MPDPETDAGVTEVTTGAVSESTAEAAEVTETTDGTPAAATEESFYPDPHTIPEDLKPYYKGMQGAFTKKMQSFKAQADKIAAYDAFNQNPRAALERMAGQYGLSIQDVKKAAEAFDPQNWDDVTSQITKNVVAQLQPMMAEVQGVKQASIEAQLDEAMPDWRVYEAEMSSALTEHPTLANDPVKLLKLTVPDNVLEAKAVQAAMRKLEAKGKAAGVSSGGTTPQGVKDATAIPDKPTFQQAYERAKKLQSAGKI